MYSQEIPLFDIKHILENKISSVTGYTFRLYNGLPSAYAYESFYQEYTLNGEKSNSQKYDPYHNLSWRGLFDDKGNLVKKEFFNADGTSNYDLEYQYTSENKLQEKRMFLNQHIFWLKYTATLDSSGKILKETCTDKDGNLLRSDIYKYDEQGNLIAIDMRPGGSYEYKYDGKNCLALVNIYLDSGPKSGNEYLFFYDDCLLLRQVIHRDNEMSIFEYSYHS